LDCRVGFSGLPVWVEFWPKPISPGGLLLKISRFDVSNESNNYGETLDLTKGFLGPELPPGGCGANLYRWPSATIRYLSLVAPVKEESY
jgi:hypothetical protein